MAAITTLLFAHLKPGDQAITQPDLAPIGSREAWLTRSEGRAITAA